MAITNYLVSYDLNKPGKDYSGVHKAIQNASTGVWCKPLESVYIIQSNLTSEGVYDKVHPFLDANDRILVVGLTGDYCGYLDNDIVKYLSNMM